MNYIIINNKKIELNNVSEDTPVLWVLRDHLNLTGTKFGCGVGMCGACTVLVDGVATRGCQTLLSEVKEKKITTIENSEDKEMNILRMHWKEEDVAQCGYCQPGQIMNATGLLKENSKPSEEDILDAMDGNICRCGTYNRIKTAIFKASKDI
ncbi:(2Fe-2S)-binding protein [Sulfurospirillum arcachonense]|uniref:(2Fe-2S)-binding protein n=1 Tax=Sulfurospirillum arcachonense TaxID=57666 RepID=UPI0004B08EF0|nr:(2Fe-2S)-binding protein [Sulfurospirillum arcachonense]